MCPGRGPVGRAQCLKVSPTKEAKRISSSHYVQIQVYSNRLITKISQKHKVIIWANGRCVEVSQFYGCDTCPKSLPLRNLSGKGRWFGDFGGTDFSCFRSTIRFRTVRTCSRSWFSFLTCQLKKVNNELQL